MVPGQPGREKPRQEGGRCEGKNNSWRWLKPQKAGGHGAAGETEAQGRKRVGLEQSLNSLTLAPGPTPCPMASPLSLSSVVRHSELLVLELAVLPRATGLLHMRFLGRGSTQEFSIALGPVALISLSPLTDSWGH